MPVSISVPVMSWMIALLAFVVLVFFVFAMVLYLRRCISSVSQQYQNTADLSSSVALLEADKAALEGVISAQKEELQKLEGERREQEAVRQDILALESRRKDLESAIEGLVAMQAEKSELEKRIAERNKELGSINAELQEALRMKDELAGLRAEYERLQKTLERKMDIEAAVRSGESRMKQNEQTMKEQEEKLSARQSRLDALTGEIEPLERKREGLEGECSELNEQLSALRDRNAEMQAQFAALNTQIPALKKATQEQEEACRKAGQRMEELRREQAALEAGSRELAGKRERAERELSDIQKRHADAKTEFAALNAQLPALRKEVQSLGQQAAGSASEHDRALEELMQKPVPLISRRLVESAEERELLQDFKTALSEAHLTFPDRTVKAFHTALKCQDINPLTVLAGVSGTGKTLLPVKYAEFMGINQVILSVQPRWDSAQDLFGFYNYLERRYKATELSRCLLRMDPYGKDFNTPEDRNIRNGMLMVLLDEMNLARPEYYFSEFLSKLELRRTVNPTVDESRSRATIELDTGTGHEHFSIWIPNNILFVGTMNEDESTQTLSDKVLDRANVLRFGKPARRRDQKKPDMSVMNGGSPISSRIWESWKKGDIRQYMEECGDWTRKLNDALAGLGRAFGFRVEEAIYSYVANYPGVKPGNDAMRMAFADQVEQKILPKLRGCDMNLPTSMDSLEKIEQVVAELGDDELREAFRQSLSNASDTGIFLWQGVTRI